MKAACLLTLLLCGVLLVRSIGAFNNVADANGTFWGIQDAPGVDTGSIRATQVSGSEGDHETGCATYL
jgi:hypothetical protein